MARLPYSGLDGMAQPGIIQAPDAYDTTRADPNAFGAGIAQADEKAGQALEGAGSTALTVATQQQAFVNRGAITDALTQAQQAAMQVQYGDPNNPNSQGFYALKGKQTIDAYGGAVGSVQDAYKAARDGLANDAQRQMFDRESRRTMMSTLATMGQHNAIQQRAYTQDAQQSLVQTNLKAAELGYTNDGAFQTSLAGALDAQQHLDAMQGLPPETMAANAAKVTSQAYAARILRQGADDPAGAMQQLQAAGDKVDATTQTQIMNHLRPQVDRQQGLQAGAAGIAAAMPGGGGGNLPVADAIHGQESGGKATSVTSVDGAQGGWQVMPATFQQYAQPGESISNPADNEAVGRRIISDLNTKAGGDPARVAVGYFSGPGNMAPPGSPTPWLVDKKDGNGFSTSRYVAGVLGRMGGSAAAAPSGGDALLTSLGVSDPANAGSAKMQAAQAGPAYRIPDLGTALQAADDYADAHGFSPEAKQHAESYVVQQHSRLMAAGATERTALHQTVQDLLPALGQGLDVDIPEDRIRAAFPADQAQRMLDGLHIEQQAGVMMKGLQFAPLDQVLQTVQALQVPGSVQSGKITLRRGQLAGPGMLGDSGTTAASEDPENLRMRMQIAGRAQALLQQRQQALSADPAGYAQQSPDVQRAYAAATAPGADPSALQSYVASTTALQQQMGVSPDKVRLLTNPQVAGLVSHLTKQDPAQGDSGAQLDAMAKQYGAAWPQVFGEMVEHGKLPRDFQVLATMDQPGQVVGRQDVQRMLTFMAQKGGPKEMMADLPKGVEQTLRQNIDDTMSDFRATTANSTGGLQLFSDVRDSVMHLAAFRVATRGGDAEKALTQAYTDIIGQKYDLDGAMRVPKGMLGDARTATGAAQAALQPGDLRQIGQGSTPGLTPEDTQAAYARDVRSKGFWVPNRDDSGLALMVPVRNSATPQAVFRPDGGRIEVKFADMRGATAGAAAQAAAAPGPSALMQAGP